MTYYTRWSLSSWHIFWQQGKAKYKVHERLACWYAPDVFHDEGFGAGSMSYVDVKAFVANPDWSIWQKLSEGQGDQVILISSMTSWLDDMDGIYKDIGGLAESG